MRPSRGWQDLSSSVRAVGQGSVNRNRLMGGPDARSAWSISIKLAIRLNEAAPELPKPHAVEYAPAPAGLHGRDGHSEGRHTGSPLSA